jgi:hypothetical protein
MKTNIKLTVLAVSAVLHGSAFAAGAHNDMGYEVWLSDQTNTRCIGSSGECEAASTDSVTGGAIAAINNADTGTHGGRIHIYDSTQLDVASPSGSGNSAAIIKDTTADWFPNAKLDTSGHVVRNHGILPTPDHEFMIVNFVGSGHLGVVNGDTKNAVCLFRSTGTSTGRQNHMSFPSPGGDYILVANQAGKMMERVNITRDLDGVATAFTWDETATLDLVGGAARLAAGQEPRAVDMDTTDGISCDMLTSTGLATAVPGAAVNTSVAKGTAAWSAGSGQSASFTLGTKTYTKQATSAVTEFGTVSYRPNNQVVCPLVTSNNMVFTTLAGGGMFVVDLTSEPMNILGAYSGVQSSTGAVVNAAGKIRAAGCGGIEEGGFMYVNSGTNGSNLSEFAVYKLPMAGFPAAAQNSPSNVVTLDAPATLTFAAPGGAAAGTSTPNGSTTTANNNRDSHGMVTTATGTYLHQFDRVQNTARSVHLGTLAKHEYSLTTENVCGSPAAGTVVQAGQPTINDPAPDLASLSPHGDLVYVALRGPYPLTISHAALGTCPGLGVVQLENGGKSGKLVHVLPTANLNAAGNKDISDPHAAIVRIK